MNLDFYLESKKKEIEQQYDSEYMTNDTWNQIKSQIKSGYFLGLNESELDMLAVPSYNYAQREIIKYACFSKIPEHVITELSKQSDYKDMTDNFRTF